MQHIVKVFLLDVLLFNAAAQALIWSVYVAACFIAWDILSILPEYYILLRVSVLCSIFYGVYAVFERR